MKRLIATAATCGVSLFGFTAAAGAAGPPPANGPNPSPTAPLHTGTACLAVSNSNPVVDGIPPGVPANPPGIVNLDAVGSAFCGF